METSVRKKQGPSHSKGSREARIPGRGSGFLGHMDLLSNSGPDADQFCDLE